MWQATILSQPTFRVDLFYYQLMVCIVSDRMYSIWSCRFGGFICRVGIPLQALHMSSRRHLPEPLQRHVPISSYLFRFDEYCTIYSPCTAKDLKKSEWKMPRKDYNIIKGLCTKTSENCKDAIGGVADKSVELAVALR